jgi:hypothetical protein
MLRRLAACLAVALSCTAPALAAPGNLYFSDDFSGSAKPFFEGTIENRQFRYVDGQYEIDTTAAGTYGQSVLLGDLEDYRVQVSGKLVRGDDKNAGFGISLNYRERQGGNPYFILFLVYNQGAYTILRYYQDQTTILVPPTKSKLVKPGENVELMADNDGGQLTFYINGIESAALTERDLTSGGFGVFASAKTVVRFDDFKVFADGAGGFTDSFEGEKVLYQGSWGEVAYRYQGGRYIIDTSNTSFNGLSPYPQPQLNFEFAADVERTGGRASGLAGLYLRDHENPDGSFDQYRFLVSGDWFVIERSLGDRPLALTQSTQHPAINARGVNRLRVRAQGSDLVFFVNEVEVYRAKDEAPASGAYGFFASSGVTAAFDNVRFTPLP